MNTKRFWFWTYHCEKLIAQTLLNTWCSLNSVVIDPKIKEMTDTHFDHITTSLTLAMPWSWTTRAPARLYSAWYPRPCGISLKIPLKDQWGFGSLRETPQSGAASSFGDGRLPLPPAEEPDHGGRIVNSNDGILEVLSAWAMPRHLISMNSAIVTVTKLCQGKWLPAVNSRPTWICFSKISSGYA